MSAPTDFKSFGGNWLPDVPADSGGDTGNKER